MSGFEDSEKRGVENVESVSTVSTVRNTRTFIDTLFVHYTL